MISHSLISSKNRSAGESVRMTNDEYEYTNFFSTLFANYESWITHHESRIHSLAPA